MKGPSGSPEGPLLSTYPAVYFAAGAVVVTVEVTVDVTADCTAGFGASCFWHPANAKTAMTARAPMIALIFFMSRHPLSSLSVRRIALVAMEE